LIRPNRERSGAIFLTQGRAAHFRVLLASPDSALSA
jgi:hypothetical protein